MQWLFENPLANMPGPAFLLLYLALIAGVILLLRIVARHIEKGDDQRRLPIPEKIDPLQIAFLRGGDQEVIRTAAVDLLEQGRLKQVIKNSWQKFNLPSEFKLQAANPEASDSRLPRIYQVILLLHQHPQKLKTLFGSTIRSQVSKETESFQRWIEKEELQVDSEGRAQMRKMLLLSLLFLEGVGLYKLISALVHGRSNYWYLIFLMALTLIIIPLCARHRRLTRRGQDYLRDLQTAFGSLRSLQAVEKKESKPSVAGNDLSLPFLAMGIFGVNALEGSSLDPYYRSFQKSKSTASGCSSTTFSSCGSTGCGGSSFGGFGGDGGGDSGGGDGGSCGGGGCGGCGGGD